MSKPEIKSFVAFICGGGKIMQPLNLSHSIPLCVSGLVPPHVVDLRQSIYHDVRDTEDDQDTITALIAGSVVGAVDV